MKLKALAVGIAVVVSVLASPDTTRAAHIIGGWNSNHILVPWFIVSKADAKRDPTIVVTNLDTNTPNTFPVTGTPIATHVRIIIFDSNSNERCAAVRTLTAQDELVEKIRALILGSCDPSARQGLDFGDGTYRGYLVVELRTTAAGTVQRDNDFALTGRVYLKDRGAVGGFNAPGYFDTFSGGGLNIFNLVSQERMFFRFRVALNGNPGPASTNVIVWSATSAACGVGIQDSECLSGTGPSGALRVCDENETCTSPPLPSLTQELNFLSADSIVPAGFATDGGFFILRNDPAKSAGNTLSVLAYADNRVSTKSLKGSAVLPAHREVSQ